MPSDPKRKDGPKAVPTILTTRKAGYSSDAVSSAFTLPCFDWFSPKTYRPQANAAAPATPNHVRISPNNPRSYEICFLYYYSAARRPIRSPVRDFPYNFGTYLERLSTDIKLKRPHKPDRWHGPEPLPNPLDVARLGEIYTRTAAAGTSTLS